MGLKLFNTNKKIQVNRGVDKWKSFQKSGHFEIMVSTSELLTDNKNGE